MRRVSLIVAPDLEQYKTMGLKFEICIERNIFEKMKKKEKKNSLTFNHICRVSFFSKENVLTVMFCVFLFP